MSRLAREIAREVHRLQGIKAETALGSNRGRHKIEGHIKNALEQLGEVSTFIQTNLGTANAPRAWRAYLRATAMAKKPLQRLYQDLDEIHDEETSHTGED